jgi:phage-related tail fiber protein
MAYKTILTNNGKIKIADSMANNTPINLAQIAFGDGNGIEPTPDANATSLVREVYRADILSISKYPSDNRVVIAECFIPADVGGFYIRELGVYDSENNLIAISDYPSYFKPTSGAVAELSVNVMLAVGSDAVIQLMLDPSITLTTRLYVDAELAKKQDKLSAGDNITIQNNIISARSAENAGDITYGGDAIEGADNVEEALDLLATSKQNNILVFETQAAYDAAAATIPPKTLVLKLF